MKNIYNAMTIANWFVLKNNAEKNAFESDEFGVYEGITHLKLQKLLYYAQGIHLALTGGRLFRENIYAWKHGPVVQEVYEQFKDFGSDPIELELTEEMAQEINSLDDTAVETLELTYANFAIYTAWQLRNLTHEDGTPWDKVVRRRGLQGVIPSDTIREYFLENVVEQ